MLAARAAGVAAAGALLTASPLLSRDLRSAFSLASFALFFSIASSRANTSSSVAADAGIAWAAIPRAATAAPSAYLFIVIPLERLYEKSRIKPDRVGEYRQCVQSFTKVDRKSTRLNSS